MSWLGLMGKQERIERATVDTLRDEIRTGLDSGAGKRAEDVFAQTRGEVDQPVSKKRRG